MQVTGNAALAKVDYQKNAPIRPGSRHQSDVVSFPEARMSPAPDEIAAFLMPFQLDVSRRYG